MNRTLDVDRVLADFPRERRFLVPALQAVQAVCGHLSTDALARVAAHVRVPASEVYGVATGYPELRLRAHGTHHVRACTGVTCALLGGRGLLARLERRFDVERSDGKPADVTIEAADCFFQCSMAPLLEVDGTYIGRATGEDADRVMNVCAETERETLAREARRDGVATAGPRSTSSSRVRLEADPTQPDVAREARATPEPRATPARERTSPTAVATLDALAADARRRRSARPALRLLVQTGTCGRSVGAEAVIAALRAEMERRHVSADIVDAGCNGMCYAAPLVEVTRGGWPRFVLERPSPARMPALVDALASDVVPFDALGLAGVAWTEARWRGLTPAREHPFWRAQERLVLRRAGSIDPGDVDDAVVSGAYRSLARALDGTPDGVIAEIEAAGLHGRGGAFFPAAVKWEACRRAPGEPKYLVMNGEEGEPGIFKDRHLMEGDPHQVLEGVLIAAYAAGATRAILYVHGEANLAAARLAQAVADAEAAGIAGGRMLGREVACHLEIRRGAGGFVLGEETALLESIEGKRAQPRTRPPFPVESGLWGKPTVINNVETLSAVPPILEGGAAGFLALGTPKAAGTKVFGLSGPIRRPGVVEARNGVTLAALLDTIGGGLLDGRPFLGALVGGPSGTIVPAGLFDVPMEPRGEVSPGTGGVVALPEDASVADIVRTLLVFNERESCGKCTPCREGAPRLLALLDELVGGVVARAGDADPGRMQGDRGHGRRDAGRGESETPAGRARARDREDVVARIRALAEAMQYGSLCGLGQSAPLALVRALETFPAAFRGA